MSRSSFDSLLRGLYINLHNGNFKFIIFPIGGAAGGFKKGGLGGGAGGLFG